MLRAVHLVKILLQPSNGQQGLRIMYWPITDDIKIKYQQINCNRQPMSHYFSKSAEPGPLKQLPLLRSPNKIIKISYPHNCLQKLPLALSKAYNTAELNLSHNKIATLDPPLFQLRKLRLINLSFNMIANVPRAVLKLRYVEQFDLGFNLLVTVRSVEHLYGLYRVRAGGMRFSLEGNHVLQLYGEELRAKIHTIDQEITIRKQKMSKREEIRELEFGKSVQLRGPTPEIRSDLVLLSQQSNLLSNSPQKVRNLGSLPQNRSQLQKSLDQLLQTQRKMELIAGSKFKLWNQHLCQLFSKQYQLTKDLISLYKQTLGYVLQQFSNPSEITSRLQSGFIRCSQTQQLIKQQHALLLEELSESDAPIVAYKIWVQLYKQARELGERLRWEAWAVVQASIRGQEIQALKLISPGKYGSGKGRDMERDNMDVLEGLLFSKKKQTQEGENDEITEPSCQECYIKNEDIKQLRAMVEQLTLENQQNRDKIAQLTKHNQEMLKNDIHLDKKLRLRQQQIIASLDQRIDASVYQKILMEQALGIEDLIKCGRHEQPRRQRVVGLEKTHKLCETATAIAKQKCIEHEQQQPVSDFTCQERYNTTTSISQKRPYFQSNEEYESISRKRSRRNTQNSKNTTEKKNKNVYESDLKKNQPRNSLKNHINGNKNMEVREFSCHNQGQGSEFNRGQDKQNVNYNNGKNIVTTSDFVITQPQQTHNKQNANRRILSQLLSKKELSGRDTLHFKPSSKNLAKPTNNNRIIPKMQSGHTGGEHQVMATGPCQSYVSKQYKSVPLKDEKPYQQYMRYHLRNSIIETLCKAKNGRRCASISKMQSASAKNVIAINRSSTNKSTTREIRDSSHNRECLLTERVYSRAVEDTLQC